MDRLLAVVQLVSSSISATSSTSLFIGMYHAQTVITWAVDDHGIEFTVRVIGRIPVVGELDIALIERAVARPAIPVCGSASDIWIAAQIRACAFGTHHEP